MIEVYKIFENLQQKTPTHKEGFIVASLPFSIFHKIKTSSHCQCKKYYNF